MFVSVAIDLALDRLFTYAVPAGYAEKLKIGQLLRVPFSGRMASGFAMKIEAEIPQGLTPSKIKPVLEIVDEAPFFSPGVLELVKWIASYTASPIESVLRAAVPAVVLKPSAKPKELLYVEAAKIKELPALTKYQAALLSDIKRVDGGWLSRLANELNTTAATLRVLEKKGVVKIAPRVARRDPLAGRTVMPTKPLPLNEMQAKALSVILESPDRPVLLHGVTGSGKTEVYLQAIAREIESGRGAIVLVPEIALTPQTVRRFAGRFGDRIAVLHSALSDGERYDEWQRIRRGEAKVVVGPRSAVFAPVRNPGLIVVDEEHDPSYKQDDLPRYHARDIAVVRARLEGAKVVLGSATPSLESWFNARKGKYAFAPIPNRVAGHSMPDVTLVDMQDEQRKTGHVPIFSSALVDAIHRRLERGEQTILFLNRRGYSRVMECTSCGWIAECESCSMPYTFHRADECLRCHICGKWIHPPKECPECRGREFSFTGIGTQRAEDALKKCFPSARILRMDADSTARKFSHDDILGAFRAGKADILIGTQMIAKGLDFPNVTLVGVLNADSSLHRPDPRAGERTYQLLAQVSGRAGRAEKPGEVFIQTFSPDEPVIKAAASNDGFESFAEMELAARREDYFPPYCRLSTIVVRSKDDSLAAAWANLYAEALKGYAKKYNEKNSRRFVVGDAVPSELMKAEGWYRYQIVMRAPHSSVMTNAVKWLGKERPAPADVRIAYDVDAISLI